MHWDSVEKEMPEKWHFFQMNCPLRKILNATANILMPKSCCLSRGDVAYTGDTMRWLKLNHRPKIASPKPCCTWLATRPPTSSCCKNLLGQEFPNYQEEREGIEILLTEQLHNQTVLISEITQRLQRYGQSWFKSLDRYQSYDCLIL